MSRYRGPAKARARGRRSLIVLVLAYLFRLLWVRVVSEMLVRQLSHKRGEVRDGVLGLN